MSLSEIASKLREKGLSRQATLLQSANGRIYAETLLNRPWRHEVIDAISMDTLLDLEEIAIGSSNLKNKLEGRSPFSARKYTRAPLEIKLTGYGLNIEQLRSGSETLDALEELCSQADKLIYTNVQEYAKEKPDTLLEIYRHSQNFAENKEETLHRISRSLRTRLKQLQAFIKIDSDFITEKAIELLSDILPAYQDDSKLAVEYRAEAIQTYALSVINDPELDAKNFEQHWQHHLDTLDEKIMKHAFEAINNGINGLDLGGGDTNNFLDEKQLKLFLQIEHSLGHGDLYQQLLKAPLNLRSRFCDIYPSHLDNFRSTLTGMQQIIDGGLITDPTKPEISTRQNHNGYPNINYSEETKRTLNKIVSQYMNLLTEVPDLSSLPIASRLRKRREHQFSMSEMPKNPLDVTFGNDSGACINVPIEYEKLANGESVPHYLDHPSVRLIGTYLYSGNGKKNRMGLVLAFDMHRADDPDYRVLACNSLELSKFQVPGGAPIIESISEYAENKWLPSYAKRYRYQGATMGGHSYNTSANHSQKSGDVVQDFLVLKGGVNTPFFSDILSWDTNLKNLTLRPNSSYWLWKKE
jgi:hypothetical protein